MFDGLEPNLGGHTLAYLEALQDVFPNQYPGFTTSYRRGQQDLRNLIVGPQTMSGCTHAQTFGSEHPDFMFANYRQPSNLSVFHTPESSRQIHQRFLFVGQPSIPSSQAALQEVSDLPMNLPLVESMAEEWQSTSMLQSQPLAAPRQQPGACSVDTSSDSGTYSCTYHGCHLRFETQAKLQKHKREGHRQASPSSSSASNLASQAGPHRCDRINPSTGKPCNSIFSRPYDLTRHEDTIHNSRKQKIRCHLCSEEKTFSRNDALARHMRVVHPDVDWVGKQKRSVK